MRRFLKSFRFAFNGLLYLFKSQPNARIHLLAALAVLAAGAFLKINLSDWAWLVVAIAMVLCAEAFNTSVELLADRITTEHDAQIGRAKDVAAAGVLIACTGAFGIGIVILTPHLLAISRHG